MTTRALLHLALLVVSGFGLATHASAQAPPVLVRDSAGIRVVESVAERWTAAGPPLGERVLRVGGLDDERAALAAVSGALLLPDGTLVISQGDELTFVDASGERVASVRRPGAGPGEFRFVQALAGHADGRVAAWAPGRLSVLLFDAGGRHLTDVPIEGAGPGSRLVGATSSGSYVFAHPTAEHFQRGRVTFQQTRFVLHDADGRPGTTLATLPEAVGYESTLFGEPQRMELPTQLAPGPRAAVTGDRIWIGGVDLPEIRVYDGSGRLVEIQRSTAGPVPFGPPDAARFRDELLGAAHEDARGVLERLLAELPWPEHFPPFGELLGGPSGDLWACDGAAAATPGLGCWVRLAPDGALRGRTYLPQDAGLLAVSDGRVVLVRLGELQVPEVLVYRLSGGR